MICLQEIVRDRNILYKFHSSSSINYFFAYILQLAYNINEGEKIGNYIMHV